MSESDQQPISDQPERSDSPVQIQSQEEPSNETKPGRRPRPGDPKPQGDRQRKRSTQRSQSTGSRHSRRTRNFVDPNDPNFDQTVTKYQRSPGPAYDTGAAADKFVLHRSFQASFGKAPRTSTTRDISPGPQYDVKTGVLSNHPASPRGTFGKASYKSSLIRDTAGADSPLYSVGEAQDKMVLRNSFHASFGKSKRDGGQVAQTPGPQYDVKPEVLSTHPASPRGTFGKASYKSSLIRDTAAAEGPLYSVGEAKDKMVLRNSFHASFGSAPRTQKSVSASPGPQYDVRPEVLSTHPASPRGTFGKASYKSSLIRETSASDGPLPGPTEYEKIGPRSPRATFGTSARSNDKKMATPGPGAYDTTNDKKVAVRGSFGKSERGSSQWIFS
ncbi:hypothetical protein BLNAU_8173 [Blattamonas nauphoetae]|uniref:Uncharacterized protein n=1 Tax=Blattamonas nauphoetae TaxID=2049346 RepID=A0ABQ9XZI5_9EUKA|nr:hypothetical protein BLNAU_8173 [Blattamonas nauphoetae]